MQDRKEALHNRLAQIEKAIAETNAQIQQIMANLNMMLGNKQEIMYWLTFEDMPNPEKENEPLPSLESDAVDAVIDIANEDTPE